MKKELLSAVVFLIGATSLCQARDNAQKLGQASQVREPVLLPIGELVVLRSKYEPYLGQSFLNLGARFGEPTRKVYDQPKDALGPNVWQFGPSQATDFRIVRFNFNRDGVIYSVSLDIDPVK